MEVGFIGLGRSRGAAPTPVERLPVPRSHRQVDADTRQRGADRTESMASADRASGGTAAAQ
jgi:hypothetical protein